MEDKKVILEVKDLKKYFPLGKGKLDKNKKYVKAVDGVSFKLYEGETLGLVGESGCGKSTLGRAILRLHEPTSGEVHFYGEDILKKNRKEMRKLREEMQIIFQDPYSSLNPRMNVYYRYPHQFSGGQRQRIGIARSLALDPSFIVCDEPVSALDVSIQSQIINLMMDMQEERKISYIFISHDLSVVKHISNRVGVMYLGSLVELADKDEIYENPQHPYTKALMAAIPKPDPTQRSSMEAIHGEIPSNVNVPSGCKFHPRCPYAKDICKTQEPAAKEIKPGHVVLCHFGGEF